MRTFVSALLFIVSFALRAEDFQLKDCCTRLGISGRVIDAVTERPVFGAKVWLQYQFMTSGLAIRFPGEATTDKNGEFRIPSEFVKRKYLYGVTDDPTDPRAWKPDVPVKIQVDHPSYNTFRFEFPTIKQNKKVPYLRQTYPIFQDGADYRLVPKK